MATRAQGEVPAGMQGIFRRSERWQRSHRGRLPIPERLWASAVEAAREHGVFRTAKIVHLESGKLKRLAEAAARGNRVTAPSATFLELMSPSATGL